MSESEIQIAYFPDEIVKEILSRIPVKALLQFRCVSKHWKDLMSGTHFIKSHLKNALSSPTQHRILLPTFILSSPLLSLSYNNINESVELDFPFLDSTRTWVDILGSCNGLVCLIVGLTDMIIYNPSTRKHFRPVLSPQQTLHRPYPAGYVYGFGCCSNSNEMRVVRFPRFSPEQWNSDIARNGSNSWTSGVASSCYGFIDIAGTFLNGFLHWLAYLRSSGDDDHIVIASFNLSEETFTDLSLPPQKGSRTPRCVLGVLQGCLSALCDDMDHIEVEIWLMKEYGVANSWTKFVKIPLQMGIEDISCMMPLGSLNEDEILMQIDQRLFVFYDAKKKLFRGGTSEYYDLLGDAVVYVESLLSPQVLRLLY